MPKPLARLPQPNGTSLSPLEEHLFKAWARVHGVHDQIDQPDSHFDFRKAFKDSNGRIHPEGQIPHAAGKVNELMQSSKDNHSLLDEHVQEHTKRNQEQHSNLGKELAKRAQALMGGLK